jgi:hypothetical protein
MYKTLIAAVLSIAALAGTASASTISYSTRGIDHGVNPADYAASWAAQTSAISSNSISDFNGTTPGLSSFAHLQVGFDAGTPLSILFQIAPDAGFGGALYLDGALVDVKAYDLWWGGSWAAVTQILSASAPLSSGHHTLDGFWAEGCCSGGQGGRFSVNGGASWASLSVASLDRLAVPEPGMLALFGIGVAGLGMSRRQRKS